MSPQHKHLIAGGILCLAIAFLMVSVFMAPRGSVVPAPVACAPGVTRPAVSSETGSDASVPVPAAAPLTQADAAAARNGLASLKAQMRADHTDFARMQIDLEERLHRAPDGKITPAEVLAVIPPQHRAEFKSVLAGMYPIQARPAMLKETRP